MRLILKNFKQHTNLDITFPSAGLVQISGESGVGKTTIFDAINEIINGDGKDVITWGKDTGLYTLKLPELGMVITRSRRPNNLRLEYDGGLALDDHAQEIIYSRLGANADEFGNAAYIMQKQSNSLVSMQPADMGRMINKLSNKGMDPDLFKKFVNQKISEKEKKIKELEVSSSSKSAEIRQLETHLNTLADLNPPEEVEEPDMSVGSEIARKHSNLKDTLTKMRSIIPLKTEIKLISVTLEEKNNSLASLVDVKFDPEELGLLHLKIEYAKYLQKLNKIRDKALSLGKPETESTWDFLNRREQELINEENQVSEERRSFTTEILELELPDPLKCPHCSGDLTVKGLSVLPYAPVDNDRLNYVKVCVDRANEKLKQIFNAKKDITAMKSEAALILHFMRGLAKTDESLDVLQARVKELELLKTESENIAQTRKDLTLEISRLNTRLDKEKERLKTLDVVTKLLSESDITSEMEKLEKEMIEFNSQRVKYGAFLDLDKSYRKSIALKESLTKSLDNFKQELKEIDQAIISEKKTLSEYYKILEQVEISAMAAIERVITFINLSSRKYIDQLFPDTGTVINILNLSTTKKGEERAKPSIETYHKGNKFKGLSPFSGGEQSRVALAFQLAVGEMYSIPFLMIDEGFSGLSMEAKRDGLEFLKTCAINKLILVVEHGAPEHLFDEVIKL